MVDRYLNSLLGENESMLFITRQHWLVLLREIVLEILSTLAIAIPGNMAAGSNIWTGVPGFDDPLAELDAGYAGMVEP
jgi:hypothetical protein